MSRWATHLFIASYLGVLGFGLISHALTFLKTSHPAMYFIVWDMYCGWSSLETRLHVIGEGESGEYYSLSHGPWGEFVPFGSVERLNYDSAASYGYRLASNTLAQTDHEPVHRIFVIEEAWPKKYNLPEPLWQRRYGTEKPAEPHSYFHVRRTYNASGETLQLGQSLTTKLSQAVVLDNPKLRAEMHRGKTFLATEPSGRQSGAIQTVGFETEPQ